MVFSEYIDTRSVWHEELDERHEEMFTDDVVTSQGRYCQK
jgi:hypothetical protein